MMTVMMMIKMTMIAAKVSDFVAMIFVLNPECVHCTEH